MKLFFTATILFLSSHLTAQYHFYSEDDRAYANDRNTLTDIPLLPDSNKKVDVFFNDESPQQAYYKVRIIEVSTSYSDYNRLLALLKQKAAGEGFDAIKLLGKTQSLVQDNSLGTAVVNGVVGGVVEGLTDGRGRRDDDHYHAPLINIQSLSAIGIKYKARINYIDSVVKTATIHFPGKDIFYKVDFNLSGLFPDAEHTDARDYYLKNISVFKNADLLFKAFEQSNFQKVVAEPVNGKMKTDSGYIKYLAYSEPQALVRINLPSGQFPSIKKYFVSYKMKNNYQPSERIISYRKKRPLYKDVYLYDDGNRCYGFVRYDVKSGNELLKVQYDFFTVEDLPKAELF